MFLGGPQTRLNGEFGCTSGCPGPRDSSGHDRRHMGGCSLLFKKVCGHPVSDVDPRLLVCLASVTLGTGTTRSGPSRVTEPEGHVGGVGTDL